MALSTPVAQAPDITHLSKLGLTSEDAYVLTTSHANALILGVPQITEGILLALTPFLRPPVSGLDASMALPNAPQGTLILRDLETLDSRAQENLLRWLDGVGAGTRIISLSSVPLYPRVEQQAFLDTLYYRLNILYFEVGQAFGRT
jgi:hypothetical protein